MDHVYTEQWFPHPIEKVFKFYGNETYLDQITPPWLVFKVLGKSTDLNQTGTLIDYRLRIHNIPVRWRSRLEDWVDGVRFTDTQVKGPYSRFSHLHEFEPHKGGTLMKDTIFYELPMGTLGKFFIGSKIRKDLQNVFTFRAKAGEELFLKTIQ